MPNIIVPAAGEAMPAAKSNGSAITRRNALSMLAAAAAVVALPSALAGPEDQVAEIMRLLDGMSPMRRTFIKQQIYSLANGEWNVISRNLTGDDFEAVYEEWLSGFGPELIVRIENGLWGL